MAKQRRTKILPTTNEKENQGQRKSHLQMPPQRKHIFKNKKKLQQNDRSVSNSTLEISSSISPHHHHKTFFKSNLLSRAQSFIQQPLSSLTGIGLPLEESECKDCFFGQFNTQLFKKVHISQSLGIVGNYLSSIGEHLFEQQSKFPMPIFHYNTNGVFCESDRLRYVQLIYSFCRGYRFKADTIFLALSLFHRISFDKQFDAYNNSLKAISSLFVAAKYQQIAIPKLESFINIDPHQIILAENVVNLESHMLIYFKFSMSFPSPLQFIELLAIRYDIDQNLKNKMIQLCYRSLSNLTLWQGRGSLLALACFSMLKSDIEMGLERNEYIKYELGWRLEQLTKLSMMQ